MKNNMKHKTVIDMFSGAGGESTGIFQACEESGMKIKLSAINHWERAIETHSKNHPQAEHYCESIEILKPWRVAKDRVALLWASPECTHHSVARSGRPKDDQSRSSAWNILKWVQELYIERIIIENVPEFESWGPIDEHGNPVESMKGKTFRAFLSALRSFGYSVDYRVLNAADYGDPTTRRRLFVQAVKGGKRIAWPSPTHLREPDMFTQSRWRSAADCIDWTIAGESIFGRKKPLCSRTLDRIAHGLRRFGGKNAEPFLVMLYGKSNVRSIDGPMPTVTCGPGHIGICQPFIVPQHAGSPGNTKRVLPISEPLPTVTTSGAHALVEPFLITYYGNGTSSSLRDPLDTVTTKDRFALIESTMIDIRFRMLRPHELSAAQGFPKTYDFCGTKTEVIKQIGNAVPVNMAKALAKVSLTERR
jgi:DNA (cytosine-5)-methyltransferase 1